MSRNLEQNGRAPLVTALCLLVLIGLGSYIGWMQRFAIYDWARLRDYSPPAAIVQLATDTTMADGTRRVFYAYRPALQDKTAFNTHCQAGEKTIVLGCYVRNQGIYLYDVTDERLAGIEQVTAAHEVLHAHYDRLSNKERQRVNTLTQTAYATVTNPRIRATIDSYQKNGADVPNELHSILGTEVKNLPPALEAYYAQYFSNRQQVVAYSEKYESEFTRREEQVNALDAQITKLRADIDSRNTQLDAQSKQISAEYDQLVALRKSGQISAYNAGIAGYNQQVNAYNAAVRTLQQLVKDHNDAVAARNAIAIEENELFKAIDNRTTTIDTQ